MMLRQYCSTKRARLEPFKIRIAPEIEACMPIDSEPQPVPRSADILTAFGFEPDPLVQVQVGDRIFNLVMDFSVECEKNWTNCEYTLPDNDIVMFTRDAPQQVEKLYDDLKKLWDEKNLKQALYQTDSMHVHVSLYDDNDRPITTTTHPFLEFFLQTIYVKGTLKEWAKKVPGIRQKDPLPQERVAPSDDFHPRYDLNVKPISDDRYADVNNGERHIHVEFRSMSSFDLLSREEFVRYIELIYNLMEQAMEISSDVTRWESVLGSNREIRVYGSGIREQALPAIERARSSGYTVITIEPDDE